MKINFLKVIIPVLILLLLRISSANEIFTNQKLESIADFLGIQYWELVNLKPGKVHIEYHIKDIKFTTPSLDVSNILNGKPLSIMIPNGNSDSRKVLIRAELGSITDELPEKFSISEMRWVKTPILLSEGVYLLGFRGGVLKPEPKINDFQSVILLVHRDP
jgi:hypothetical protein